MAEGDDDGGDDGGDELPCVDHDPLNEGAVIKKLPRINNHGFSDSFYFVERISVSDDLRQSVSI